MYLVSWQLFNSLLEAIKRMFPSGIFRILECFRSILENPFLLQSFTVCSMMPPGQSGGKSATTGCIFLPDGYFSSDSLVPATLPPSLSIDRHASLPNAKFHNTL